MSPYGDTALLAISTAYIILDCYYIAWINSLKNRAPPYVSTGFMQAAFGSLDSMYERLGEKIKKQKQQKTEDMIRNKMQMRLSEIA